MTSTAPPVLLVHGLWLHASSWQPWVERLEREGYAASAAGWPGDSPTVEATRADPRAVAGHGIDDVVEHHRRLVAALPEPPILVGHSFGGLVVQKLLGLGVGAAGVAIDPAPIKGVKPVPLSSLRSSWPVLRNPANRNRAVSLTREQFRYAFGNALSAAESDALHERWTIPSPGRPLFQAATANLSRTSEAAVDTARSPRGPLLVIAGGRDHTVPAVSARATFRLYDRSSALTELRELPDRGHSLTIDHGWPEVADLVVSWLATQGLAPRSTPAEQA
ncbi:alpha/beta hydrolase [Microlunatus flavus]|uniref:Lysophospholipase, alpha-beta hydrolase superfamily n=1 Tax=Microlunatus flavus TaxID=1036181 RepID=A0A1H9CF79_9ACTN|nr:alpha/beta hydrolase [Microlunatus flavus]SEP99855.1 Lysophospholipase, alpha-beta hydrolase superfamily [Microlunatus flavus]